MKKTLIIAALFAAALAVSCQPKELVPDGAQIHDYRTVTLKFDAPATKIDINESDGKVTWVAGDKILIHGEKYAESQTVTLKASDITADGRYATITFDAGSMAPYGAHDYYALYPADAAGQFLSGSSAYHYCEFIDTNKPLMAAYLDADTDCFIFWNLCGIISFKVSGNFDSYVFVGNNEETVGYAQLAIKRVDGDTYFKQMNDPKTSISGDVVADGSTPNLICIPKGVEFTDGFAIRLKKSGEIVKEAKTNSAVTIGRSKILALGDITDKLETYVPVAHHSSITGAKDLGASETANCYIITAPGSYKIPVVKGNSSVSAGDRATTKLLWETYNNGEEVEKNSVIAAVDYDDDDNYVYFKTPATLQPGNALIAAVDKDENIIWSWHIWIPETSIGEIGDYKVSKKYMMDRNLGAIVATQPTSGDAVIDIRSAGLYYQWGRKDPFVGYKFGKTSVEVSVSGASGRSMSLITEQISIDQAIAAPTSFVAYKGDWLASGYDDTLWGQGDDKTIYDPCPAGYRVPEYDTTDPIWQKVVTLDQFSSSSASTGHWWKLGSAVFPYAGCYDYDGGIAHPYDRCWLWSAKANSNQDYGEAQYVYDSSGWLSEPGWGKRKACGVPVRCVKVSGEVPEPEPDPAKPATGITIDGIMSDWADGDALAGDGDSIVEWKYGYDSSNLYFYFKIPKDKIKYDDNTESESYGLYNYKRYIYVALNTDNNKETGPATPGYGGLSIPGCDALALIYPWRGTMEEGPSIVNGTDEQGWMRSPVEASADGNPEVYGVFEGDYAYLEASIARDKVGSPSGVAKVQLSYSWNLSGIVALKFN